MSKEKMKEQILGIVSEVLGLPADEISPNRKLQEYGMDSIIGVEMISRLNRMYNLNLHKTAVYSYPTVNQLIDYIMNSLGNNENYYSSAEDEYNNTALGRYGLGAGEEGSSMAVGSLHEKEAIPNMLDEGKVKVMVSKLSAKYGEIPDEVYKGCMDMDQLAQRISDYLNLREDFGLKKK